MLDTATHLAVTGNVVHLDTYRDAVTALMNLGVLDESLLDRLGSAPGMRNALAHEYLNMDHYRVYEAMSHVDDLRRFAAAVWEWVESR
jgi:uncharacterized protein YutE (UPF0331/DUF86 family)